MTAKLKQKVQIEGIEFTITKLAGKEVRLESADGEVKYRRLTTIERLLAEQKPKRSRKQLEAVAPRGTESERDSVHSLATA